MKQALIIIDTQKDYEAQGKVPLVNMEQTIACIEEYITKAKEQGDLIVLIQHLNPADSVVFAQNSKGVEIIDNIKALVPTAPIVQKHHGNSFDETSLNDLLQQHHITHLKLVGMMTQNCVVFTALAPEAQKYDIEIIANGCTSVSSLVHQFAIRGLSRFVKVA